MWRMATKGEMVEMVCNLYDKNLVKYKPLEVAAMSDDQLKDIIAELHEI